MFAESVTQVFENPYKGLRQLEEMDNGGDLLSSGSSCYRHKTIADDEFGGENKKKMFRVKKNH